MKRIYLLLLSVLLLLALVACKGQKVVVDYENEVNFENALNAGEDVAGKVVTFTVNKVVPNSAFGYNLQTGEHLNFCSEKNPGVDEGEMVTVKVTEVSSLFGSYIITYEIIKK